MSAHQLLFICMVWVSFAGEVAAQNDTDCNRYRIAGLPCPAKPASSSTLSRDTARPPASSPASSATLARKPDSAASVPVGSAARDSSGALVSAALPVRTLITGVPALPVPPPALLAPLSPLSMRTSTATSQPASGEAREPGQVVAYWSSADEADAALASLARNRRVQPLSSSRLEHLGGMVAVFQLKTQAEAAEFRALLIRDFPDLSVDFNTRYRPLQQAQARPRIYLPQKIDQPSPDDSTQVLTSIRIGIVDGPIAAIAALANAKIIRKNFLSVTDSAISTQHATSVASIIAGQDIGAGFSGLVPQAHVYSAEIMRSVGQSDLTSSSALLRALDWLLSEKVQLINLSLGGPGDAVMARAFSRLAELAVVTVAAAGNGGPSALAAYPAAYPGVVAVTATDALDNVYAQANRGTYITLAAPGVDLWVPDAGAGHYVSGTSFAAAVVTAASAFLLTRMPQLNARSLPLHLCRSAKDLGIPGHDLVFGCGLIQIGAVLRDGKS